ncbi:MAG TPA: outer membrane beta-barrel protein [bacterium]|nr:outer membrane beta-barrel protein [bacterium]
MRGTRWFPMLLLVALALGAQPALARQGFFAGGGVASQDFSGDFKGDSSLTSVDGTQVIVPGKPDTSNGLEFMLGYGFNRFFGLEFDLALTGNFAHADVAGFPSKSSSSVSTDMLGVRLTLPATDRWDVFARLGLAGATMSFRSFAHANLGTLGTVPRSVAFSGYGTAGGLGVEYFFGHLGIGLGYTQYQIGFDRSSATGISALPSTLNETINQADVTAAYHF